MQYENIRENSHWWWALGISAAAVAAIGIYWWQSRPAPEPAPPPQVAAPAPVPAPAPPPEPVIEHPVEPTPTPPQLPALADSDGAAEQALAGVLGSRAVKEWFITDQLIRRIVATVDNLPREKLAQRLVPMRPVAGSFGVLKNDDALLIGAENARRYDPYVALLTKVDAKQAASLYRQFYPLFQRAYEDLGYPKAYFNDRLIAVIDHLLAAPRTPALVKLTQPKVLYEFADPELQSRSSGQKILLRMGNENAARVKAKLRELRAELARKM
jgi:hypothetical protein